MPSKRMNRNFTYSPELKLQAVKLYLEGHSCQSICEQLKIQDPKRIYVGNKAYQEKGELAFCDGQGKQATGRPKTKFMSLEEEVEYLRAQNLMLKKSIERKRGVLTKQQQFEFIHNHASEFSISLLLKLTTVSRAGYYQWKHSKPRKPLDGDQALYQLILDVFNESKKTYGVRRIKAALLNKHGLIANHKCIHSEIYFTF